MTRNEIFRTYEIDTDDENENNFQGLYNLFIDYEIATESEIQLVCNINGENMRALLDILYCRNGLRSIEQLIDEIAE